jgi:hypothetical protein
MRTTLLVLGLLVSHTAAADPALHADAEVDPTAYALSGNSLHVGIGYRAWRLDVGNFGLALPRWVHGNDDFDVAFDGYGLKLQRFLFAEQRGLFVGVDAGVVRTVVERRGTDLAARDLQLNAGVAAGYRFAIHDRFYATAWLGVGRVFGARTVTLDGARFEPQRTTVFPAIHVGYRFR